MRVDVATEPDGFRYAIEPEADDRLRVEGRLLEVTDQDMALVRREYRVQLPADVTAPHPDLHAYAVWLALRPFVGTRLALPFAVSAPFAEVLRRSFGVTLSRVDPDLSPRRPPASARGGLLFSGGVDSVAAALVVPEDVPLLFLDRIPHVPASIDPSIRLIDLAPQRAVGERLRALGRPFLTTRDDHEHLFEPYPAWHSEMSPLPGLYLADHLNLSYLDTGDVLDVQGFRGYHDGTVGGWAFRRPTFAVQASPPDPARFAATLAPVADTRANLPALGLQIAGSVFGLTEVATSRVVHASPLRRKVFSCYYDTGGPYCMRCDKCFKKLILDYISGDEEVPAELFDHFLRFRHLADIFARPYFDWHHVWFYVFQKIRCDHWFVRALQEQTRRGPDLSLFERWYPPAAVAIPTCYRDAVVANVGRYLEPMSAAEVQTLESLVLPPLEAPAVPAGYRAGEPSPWPGHEVRRADFQDRPTTLRVVFRDRLGRYPDFAFYVGRVEDGDRVFRQVGPLGLGHAPCRQGKVFQLCAEALLGVLGAAPAPPGPDTLPRWRAAIAAALARTPLPRRFDCTTSAPGR